MYGAVAPTSLLLTSDGSTDDLDDGTDDRLERGVPKERSPGTLRTRHADASGGIRDLLPTDIIRTLLTPVSVVGSSNELERHGREEPNSCQQVPELRAQARARGRVLLDACAQNERRLSRAELKEIVTTSPKQRFALSADEQRIRANQGHSIIVDLGYEPVEPPDVLFHGTVARLLPSIRDKGLQRMERHHVHLSPDEATARAVGGRRGKPVILRIDTRAMRDAGHVFFVTPNGVWLTDTVPSSFISGWDDD